MLTLIQGKPGEGMTMQEFRYTDPSGKNWISLSLPFSLKPLSTAVQVALRSKVRSADVETTSEARQS